MRLTLCILSITCAMLAAAPLARAVDTEAWKPSLLPPGYSVQTVAIPDGVQFGVAGLDVAPNGDVFAATRFGDVWKLNGVDGKWTLFAEGLNEPAGLRVNGRTGDLLVAQKPELTRVVDEDNDGVADLFQTVCDDFGFSGNYHEFAFGPVQDSAGNRYVTLNLSHGGGRKAKGSTMSTGAPFRGTCVKIDTEGKMSVFAWGLRSPAGLGIDPRTDDVFYTDNQGDWNPSSTLHHVVKDRFHGHPASLYDNPEWEGRDIDQVPDEEYDRLRKLPAAWIPHGEIANSPGNPIVDITGGKFGPFEGQLFIGDQTRSNIFRVALEKVGGEYQGCVINFIDHLQCGAIRIAFAPDGSMWVGQTSRGWGAVGGKPYGVQRIVYDGKTTPFEIHSVSLTKAGFDVRFTKPVDPKTATDLETYHVKHWHYHYKSAYGSPKYDETFVKPTKAELSADGKTVHLTLPELLPEKVYALTAHGVQSAEGESVTTKTAYYTLNKLRE